LSGGHFISSFCLSYVIGSRSYQLPFDYMSHGLVSFRLAIYSSDALLTIYVCTSMTFLQHVVYRCNLQPLSAKFLCIDVTSTTVRQVPMH